MKARNCASKTRDIVSKMMDFIATRRMGAWVLRISIYKCKCKYKFKCKSHYILDPCSIERAEIMEIAPENDAFVLKHGHLFCNSRYVARGTAQEGRPRPPRGSMCRLLTGKTYTFYRCERPLVVLGPDGFTPVALTTAVVDSPLPSQCHLQGARTRCTGIQREPEGRELHAATADSHEKAVRSC